MVDQLLRADPLGLPVPPSWLFGLKVFGFILHMIFMNLWLAGMPTALLLRNSQASVADRLFKAMPFFMAFGINAGIVPLLFLQVLYPQFFYPATILQAWFWFLIIPLLIVAYYAVYFAAFGRYRVLAATVASLLLAWIGVTFSAAMTLTAAPQSWPAIFMANAAAGSVHGFALYLNEEAVAAIFHHGRNFLWHIGSVSGARRGIHHCQTGISSGGAAAGCAALCRWIYRFWNRRPSIRANGSRSTAGVVASGYRRCHAAWRYLVDILFKATVACHGWIARRSPCLRAHF